MVLVVVVLVAPAIVVPQLSVDIALQYRLGVPMEAGCLRVPQILVEESHCHQVLYSKKFLYKRLFLVVIN